MESDNLFFALLAAAGVYFLSQDGILEGMNPNPTYQKRVVVIHSETCGYCVNMLDNVINDKNMQSMGFEKKMDDGSGNKRYCDGNTRIKLVNASTSEGKAYMNQYELDGLPSFLIFDKSGNLLNKQSGALNLQEFKSLL